jgi:hypothetical protein
MWDHSFSPSMINRIGLGLFSDYPNDFNAMPQIRSAFYRN